jgi:hypothetical protein
MGKLSPPPRAVSLLLLLLVTVVVVTSSTGAVTAAATGGTTTTTAPPHVRRRRYDAIFSLGDSYADTGNGPVVFGWHGIANPVMRPPYGSTFFGRPTGRNCDGRLAIDFLGARRPRSCPARCAATLPFAAHLTPS